MALIEQIEQGKMNRNTVHDAVKASYQIFEDARGDRYLQIDTFGSERRSLVGKKSQSIQFGPFGIAALRKLLGEL